MIKYFSLAEDIKPRTASAYTEDATVLSHELIPDLIGKAVLPFDLYLRSVKFHRNGPIESNDLTKIKHLWVDYQPNNLAWPLMSHKMKELVEFFLTGGEGIIWMKVLVRTPDETREYFIPQFTRKLDVLDKDKTTYVDETDLIVRPVYSLDKINRYSLFHRPGDYWQITLGLYVNRDLMTAIRTEKLTGVAFDGISVA